MKVLDGYERTGEIAPFTAWNLLFIFQQFMPLIAVAASIKADIAGQPDDLLDLVVYQKLTLDDLMPEGK